MPPNEWADRISHIDKLTGKFLFKINRNFRQLELHTNFHFLVCKRERLSVVRQFICIALFVMYSITLNDSVRSINGGIVIWIGDTNAGRIVHYRSNVHASRWQENRIVECKISIYTQLQLTTDCASGECCARDLWDENEIQHNPKTTKHSEHTKRALCARV